MTINPALVSAYRWHRNHAVGNRYPRRAGPNPAIEAIAAARNDVAAGKARFQQSYGWNPPFETRGAKAMRWIEKPSECGLRFVGYASDLVDLRHTGWYVDNDQFDTAHGVVFQLPARHGKPLFVAGYDDPNNGAANAGGPVALDFGDTTDDQATAARWADRIAEWHAESEREYQAAYSAGDRWAEIGEEIKQVRGEIRAAISQFRKARAFIGDAAGATYNRLCEIIRGDVSDDLEKVRELRAERAKLAEGDFVSEWLPGWNTRDSNSRDAFNEGAGAAVV